MTFTDGVAVSAIILAVVAIASEVLFFIVQTDRAAKSQREISDYVGQMRELLGKIEGLTTGTREQLQEQFRWLLERAVGEERAHLAADVAKKLDALEKAFAEVEAKAGSGLNGRLAPEVEALKERVSSLSSDLSAVAKKAAGAAAEPGRRPARDKGVVLAIVPTQITTGGKVRIRTFGPPTSPAAVTFKQTVCQVITPDNNVFSASVALSDSKLLPSPSELVFPDGFEGASTDVAGLYEVEVYEIDMGLLSGLILSGGGRDLLCTGSFLVEEGSHP